MDAGKKHAQFGARKERELLTCANTAYAAGFGHGVRTIEISFVAGAGGGATWHIFVDRLFQGSAQLVDDEIKIFPIRNTWMTGDDIQSLAEVIEHEFAINKSINRT